MTDGLDVRLRDYLSVKGFTPSELKTGQTGGLHLYKERMFFIFGSSGVRVSIGRPIATLWFDNRHHGATPGHHWHLKIHSFNCARQLTTLARHLEEDFEVEVTAL